MPGPKPIPTTLKVLRGNPGHEKLNKNEPKPALLPQVPEPPPFLEGYAREEWNRLITELHRLQLVTMADINPLAAYCMAYHRWRTAEESLAEMAKRDLISKGLMIKTVGGNAIQNPLVGTANRAANDMVRYASEFGLTPAARARISAGPFDDGGSQVSKFSGLLAG